MSLFDYAGYSPTTWILIFCEPGKFRWWDYFFKAGFRHVYAVKFVGQYCLTFNPHLAFTDIEFDFAEPELMVPPGATVLEVTAWRRIGRVRSAFYIGPPTCVESVKALLGIRSFMTWTPWQLYSRLVKGQHNGLFQQYRGVQLSPME